MAIAPGEGISKKEAIAATIAGQNAAAARAAASKPAAADPFAAILSRLNTASATVDKTLSDYNTAQEAVKNFDPAKAPEVVAWQEEMKNIAKEVGGAVSPVTGNITLKPNTATPDAKQQDSIAAITALLNSYGIGDLAGPITNAVMKGYSTDTIELIMQDPNSSDPLAVAFQKRFPANKVRAAAGKAVLSPAQYLLAERTYAETMKSYGVTNLATKDMFANLIANDISATEAADRIGLAVDRINNADQATKDALKNFYPMLAKGDLVAAMLNPAEALPTLKRKVQTAEIGGAALAQSLASSLEGVSTRSDFYGNITGGTMGADTLAGLGVTKAEAQKGYANIADLLPRSEFLSSITQGEDYTQVQAEQEQFQGLASAKRAREKLAGTETARFGGASGVNKSSLTSGTGSF